MMNKKLVIVGIAVFAAIVSMAASTAGMARADDNSGACDPADTAHTTICHIPPGNPANAQTMCVDNAAVAAHQQNHGDSIGPCQPE